MDKPTVQAVAVRSVADPMLRVRDLHGWYGESHVLHGVSFDVARGELVTLLGRNGAGKSTILKALMGMLKLRRGSSVFEQKETIALPARAIARLGIAICPEDRGIFSDLSVTENLMLPPTIGPGGMDVEEIFELFPNLRERRRAGAGKLSGGEKQMLAIARILRTGSRLLLLDEPTEGLAPIIVQQIERTIAMLKQRGYTIILVEQNLQFVRAASDYLYVIEHGEVVDHMASSDLADRYADIQRYLGI